MPGAIFINHPNIASLPMLAESIFNLLQVTEWSKRISISYEGGYYYLGTTLGIDIHIFSINFNDAPDYRFCSVFSTKYLSNDSSKFLDELLDLVARILVIHGYFVVRVVNLVNIDREQLEYTRANALDPLRNQVKVEIRSDIFRRRE